MLYVSAKLTRVTLSVLKLGGKHPRGQVTRRGVELRDYNSKKVGNLVYKPTVWWLLCHLS